MMMMMTMMTMMFVAEVSRWIAGADNDSVRAGEVLAAARTARLLGYRLEMSA